jgi:hypothetical protein
MAALLAVKKAAQNPASNIWQSIVPEHQPGVSARPLGLDNCGKI